MTADEYLAAKQTLEARAMNGRLGLLGAGLVLGWRPPDRRRGRWRWPRAGARWA